ncbi:hypothetical protein BDZ91DRAFT_751199 [Kalaharituber pfeilii]|nr:hypothetical protein BDZ91DRAFT_751199 [Kalaharituber pfeilii]
MNLMISGVLMAPLWTSSMVIDLLVVTRWSPSSRAPTATALVMSFSRSWALCSLLLYSMMSYLCKVLVFLPSFRGEVVWWVFCEI